MYVHLSPDTAMGVSINAMDDNDSAVVRAFQ